MTEKEKQPAMRISESTLNAIKNITPEELQSHGVVSPGRKNFVKGKSGYICPFCGSGTHENGSGAFAVIHEDGIYKWNCSSQCGKGYDNIHLLAEHYGLNVHNDFQEICRRACDDFSLSNYDDRPRSHSTPAFAPQEKDSSRLKKVLDTMTDSTPNLKSFVDEQGGKWRGLTYETLSFFKCGYLPEWNHSKKTSRSPRVIVPASTNPETPNYLARLTAPIETYDEEERRFIQAKEHDGEKTLFNPAALAGEVIVVVEGYIDAMSIWQAFGGNIAVVALGGLSGGKLLLNAVDKTNPKKFIVMFDGEPQGRTKAVNLREELIKLNQPAVCRFIYDALSKAEQDSFGVKVDANQFLQQRGDDKLKELIQLIIGDADRDLSALEREIAAQAVDDVRTDDDDDDDDGSELREAIKNWRKTHSNVSIEPKTIKELGAAIAWLNGLTAENFETEYPDNVQCRHSVALLGFYAPHLMRKLYSVARAAKIPCLSPSAIGSNIRYYVNNVEQAQRDYVAKIAKADYERRYRERWEENQREREKSKFKLDDEQIKYLFNLDTTDLSNAMRLNFIFGDDVRFLADLDRWLTFDKNQGVWRRGVTGNTAILPFAGKLAAMLMSNLPKIDVVSQAPEKPDPIIKTWKNSAKVSSAITFLKAVERIRITTDDLDTHKNLLNCLNGVVDLETGVFYETVDRTLLLTQQCGAAYVKDASNTDIEKFFKDALPDETTRAALIRWLGYCLTGCVNEEKALFIWGRGGNGKGTLTKLLMTLLADYAASVPVNAVIETGKVKDAGAATAELNVLDKCRLGIVEELPQGGRLDVAKFKSLTGGDKIPVRRLYEEFHNIEPTHKLILSGNHQPVLSDPRDPGLLRRLLNMNFCTDFTQNPDLHLKEKLLCHTALSSLLSILVKAAQDWYQHGLIVSNLMKNATMSYLAENDFVSEFIDEHCVFGEERSIDRKSFLNKIKNEYTAECLRMSDRMIIDTVRTVDGISYRRGGASGGYRFFGIGWRRTDASDEFSGERVNDDYALPDET